MNDETVAMLKLISEHSNPEEAIREVFDIIFSASARSQREGISSPRQGDCRTHRPA